MVWDTKVILDDEITLPDGKCYTDFISNGSHELATFDYKYGILKNNVTGETIDYIRLGKEITVDNMNVDVSLFGKQLRFHGCSEYEWVAYIVHLDNGKVCSIETDKDHYYNRHFR